MWRVLLTETNCRSILGKKHMTHLQALVSLQTRTVYWFYMCLSESLQREQMPCQHRTRHPRHFTDQNVTMVLLNIWTQETKPALAAFFGMRHSSFGVPKFDPYKQVKRSCSCIEGTWTVLWSLPVPRRVLSFLFQQSRWAGAQRAKVSKVAKTSRVSQSLFFWEPDEPGPTVLVRLCGSHVTRLNIIMQPWGLSNEPFWKSSCGMFWADHASPALPPLSDNRPLARMHRAKKVACCCD